MTLDKPGAYADFSFFLSLLLKDGNTRNAVRFMEKNPSDLAFNPLHRLEVRNGLRLRVFMAISRPGFRGDGIVWM